MKALPAGLGAHLASGATTLCWCWRLTRRDGIRLGFTDHDRDLTFDGTTFEAASGFTASEIKDQVGLGVDNLEVESALKSDRLDAGHLAAGLYDDAKVEIFRVNWQAPGERVLMRSGSLGEVRLSGPSFAAEVRGLAHYLQQPKGRVYQYGCDADLGDARCGVDLSAPGLRGSGAITALQGARNFAVSGLAGFESGWFTRGLFKFTSGVNANRAIEVKRHSAVGSTVTIELWLEPTLAPAAGDAFTVTAGCDKQLATCNSKFANVTNFRGFPHMPGNDFVAAYARKGQGGSGGSLA
jgi:uncharacterized phage protein (TIGR02218 family)